MRSIRNFISDISPLDGLFLGLFVVVCYAIGGTLLHKADRDPMTNTEISRAIGSINEPAMRREVSNKLRSKLDHGRQISKSDFDNALQDAQREQEDRQLNRTTADQRNALNGVK